MAKNYVRKEEIMLAKEKTTKTQLRNALKSHTGYTPIFNLHMIYYLLYPISLLPFNVLYRVSDWFCFLIYKVVKYRRKEVSINIKKSFYYLNEKEQLNIERQFYKIFCDNIVETIKLLSISKKELQSLVTVDYSEVKKVLSQGKKCHIYLGHQFNWEWANAHLSLNLSNLTNIIVAYKPIKNKSFNSLMLKIRSRFGSNMISSKGMKNELDKFKENSHVLLLMADQSPKDVNKSYWTNFLSQRTSFQIGSEFLTATNKSTSFFANIIQEKRGQYKVIIKPLFDFSSDYKKGTITKMFSKALEDKITDKPENHLWSHKRWKHEYKNEFYSRWINC